MSYFDDDNNDNDPKETEIIPPLPQPPTSEIFYETFSRQTPNDQTTKPERDN